jgi:hypothetical protein
VCVCVCVCVCVRERERERENWAYLISQSTTNMMKIFPFDLGKHVIKSIETYSHC